MPSFVRHASRQLNVRKQHHLDARERDDLRHAHIRRPLLLAAFGLERWRHRSYLAARSTPATAEPEPQPETPAEPATLELTEDPQAKAVAAVEAALPGLIAGNTYYTYQSFGLATAGVTPTDGGYQHANDVSILSGEGNATVTNVLLVCDHDGNVTSTTIDGALLF